MKSAKIALVVALVMTVLNSGRCAVLLFSSVRHLGYDTNPAFQKTVGTGATLLERMQAELQAQNFHQDQMALYGWTIGLAWNLLLAGLLIFAISRIQKSNY